MATSSELKAFIDTKIDNTGQRLTTGNRTRDAFDAVIDSLFNQFGEIYTTTISINANKDYIVIVPATSYGGTIRSYQIFDSNGFDITQQFSARKGVLTGDQTLTLNRGKSGTNIEVNIILK